DGAAFRRLLDDPAASANDRARAALSLTSDECALPAQSPSQIQAWNAWRLEVAMRVDPPPSRWGALLRLRRAEALAALAWQRARAGVEADAARDAQEAVRELALADP